MLDKLLYVRPNRGFAAWPTNDDLTLVFGGWLLAAGLSAVGSSIRTVIADWEELAAQKWLLPICAVNSTPPT